MPRFKRQSGGSRQNGAGEAGRGNASTLVIHPGSCVATYDVPGKYSGQWPAATRTNW